VREIVMSLTCVIPPAPAVGDVGAAKGELIMKFKDIAAIVTSQAGNEHVLAFAAQLARQNAGRFSAVVVNWQPTVVPVDGWVMSGMYAELVQEAHKQLREEAAKVERRVEKEDEAGPVQSYLIDIGAAGPAIGLRARHADVAVVARPTKTNPDSAQAILEGALFHAGRPVMIVPPEWRGGKIGRNVLVAWKPTREAARALAEADDFLARADKVSIVTVDATPGQGYGQQPGADIAAHLARRDIKPELFNLDSTGRTDTKAILDHATALGADLIVMGGYGHSRLNEFIFGGVTREILKTATLPILMSH
jgi:nucleotide-binding universal stress UspA family protein